MRIVSERLRPGQMVEVNVIRGGAGERETVRVRLDGAAAEPTR